MNESTKKKLLCMADWIESHVPEEGFDMATWNGARWDFGEVKMKDMEAEQANCGTTCCIAGWAVLAKGYKMSPDAETFDENGESLGHARYVAAGLMDLTDSESVRLFSPMSWPGGHSRFPNTPKGAAARIRHFVKTGE